MWFKGATYADVDAVCDNLSQISADEMAGSNVTDRWQVKLRAMRCKNDGFLHVGIKNEVPICIFGAIRFETNTMRTWFIGTDDYFVKDSTIIRDTIRHMAKMAKVFPHYSFESLSHSANPSALKWFRALGFSFVDIAPNGVRRYRFVGRNSTNHKECATHRD
ncbi:MAG: hypothetical protein ABJA10_06700 [Aestuariivirga sp.]